MDRICLPLQCVDHTSSKAHIQVARRSPGTEISTDQCPLPSRIASFVLEESPPDTEAVRLAKAVLRQAACGVLARTMGSQVNRIVKWIPNSTLRFSWREHHDVLVDVLPNEVPTVNVATDPFETLGVSLAEDGKNLLGDEDSVLGAELLGGVILTFGLSVAAGHSQREAAHTVLNFCLLLNDD
ncbi:MAG: hypothetical protein ABIH23_36450, partial [bacterium]